MKKILLTMAATLYVLSAVDNPFDLNDNLKKIDRDQTILLQELKKLANTQSAKRENLSPIVHSDEINVTEDNKSTPLTNMKNQEKPKTTEAQHAEQMKEVRQKMIAQELTEKVEKVSSQIPSSKPQEVQNTMKENTEEAEDSKVKEEKKRIEEEKREVAQYEAEKKLKDLQEEALREAQREADEGIETPTQTISHEKVSTEDINLTREALEAKQKAEKELQKAIMEVEED